MIQKQRKMVYLLLDPNKKVPTSILKILRVTAMKESVNDTAGIQRILKRYKTCFRVPENLNFYSRKDLIAAERKFLKYAIMNGGFFLTATTEDSLGGQELRKYIS
jgi:hypothetical protein